MQPIPENRQSAVELLEHSFIKRENKKLLEVKTQLQKPKLKDWVKILSKKFYEEKEEEN